MREFFLLLFELTIPGWYNSKIGSNQTRNFDFPHSSEFAQLENFLFLSCVACVPQIYVFISTHLRHKKNVKTRTNETS